ncbi:MAG: hypothetical protein HC908_10790 [Calothrix sp. SM1_7_51]|nr:hypothetical protein [Calothrix sp. SM1_7_51]
MAQQFSVPPGFNIRRAINLADRWRIQQLLLSWDNRFPDSLELERVKKALLSLLFFWLILNPLSLAVITIIILFSYLFFCKI